MRAGPKSSLRITLEYILNNLYLVIILYIITYYLSYICNQVTCLRIVLTSCRSLKLLKILFTIDNKLID